MEDKTLDFIKRRSQLLPKGIAPTIAIRKAQGSKLTDLNDKEYIDFISGIGVMAVGHCQEKINQVVKDQVDRFSHTCFGLIGYDLYLDLAEKLVQLFPHGKEKQDTKVFLTNSGSDSVENAIKIARAYTQRSGIIAFTNAFHGRHYMGMTLTDKPKNRKFCGPLPGEVYRLRYPSYFHHGYRQNRHDYIEGEIQAMKAFFSSSVNPEEIAAVIFEPVQGEGGFLTMPPEYLVALQKVCYENKILIITDEVQTGFGRTGKWAAYQHYIGFIPDLSVWAKAMGAGYPIGAVMGKKEIMDGIPSGLLGGTYLGNPIVCAAGVATLDYMKEVNLPAMALERGKLIHEKFKYLYETYDVIGEVRGLGAMLALEFCKNRHPDAGDPEFCKKLIDRCQESGLLLISAGSKMNVIRILCPLNIEIELLEKGLNILERELQKLVKEK